MEEITEGVTNININAAGDQKKNRIQVSNTKKPLFFYVNLAKVFSLSFSSFPFVEFTVKFVISASTTSLSVCSEFKIFF